MKVGDQEQQQVLVTKLAENARLAPAEERVAVTTNHPEHAARYENPRIVDPALARSVPVAVLAVVGLETRERGFRVWRHVALARQGVERNPHEIRARQRRRLVDCEVGEKRHSIVLERPE